jgi:hypothetical protein
MRAGVVSAAFLWLCLLSESAAAQQEKRNDLDVTMQIIVDPDAKLPDEVVRRIPLPARKSPAASPAAASAPTDRSSDKSRGNSGNSGNDNSKSDAGPDKDREDAASEHGKETSEAAQERTTGALLPARLGRFLSRWETWAGAALGAATAAAMALILLRPFDSTHGSLPQLALTLHETRNVDVLIDSERELKGATIRIAATGSIALDGFDDEQHVDWQADLERGSNLLSLPVVARAAGKGELIAVIEHDGRTRRVAVELTVIDPKVSRS